jgi:hypothetical protein
VIDGKELQRRQELFEQGYWEIPDNLDTSSFDFAWRPEPYDKPYIHQFGTQWQKSGGPRFIVPENEGIKYQAHQHAIRLPDTTSRNWRPIRPNVSMDYSWHPCDTDPPFIYVFGNQWYDSETMPTVQYRVQGATQKKFITEVRARLLPSTDRWESPDYITNFDYSWVPNPHEEAYIHQFGTIEHYALGPKYVCENSKGVKYQDIIVAETNVKSIKDMFDIVECTDSTIDVLKQHKFTKPFVYIKQKNSDIKLDGLLSDDSLLYAIDDMELLASEHVVNQIYDKAYDYHKVHYYYTGRNPELLDIVFFSNGESCADENYQRLLDMKLPNRIVRVDGVQGRVASQHAAANSSNTEWYFLVNAKLKVDESFDFNWQPDRLKSRRHYIFKAKNPINGLVYGHMAIVANNKTLTLNTKARGLDFTMDSANELVDMVSGTAVFNSDWDVWRTAFRECIKLRNARDKESSKRLEIWSTIAEGDFAQNSLQGSKDAVEYFNSVNGDFEKLKLSYDWAWLREKFNK